MDLMVPLELFVIYLCLLIPIAWWGRKQSRENTPRDFYLAGGGLGFVVLLCTLFATQYSGNTFMGFPGKAYRAGYWQLVSIPFMMAIILGYMTFARPLRRAAAARGYVTPCDWIHDRYGSLALTLLCAVLMTWALLNFLLAQLKAMGHAFSVVTDERVVIPGLDSFKTGVILLAVVIVLYETIGGMRAVAWTDTIQGVLMLGAILGLFTYFVSSDVRLAELPRLVMEQAPEKVLPPTPEKCRTWLSMLALLFFGGAMYPQGIQRLYAARSMNTLKTSLAAMLFLPIVLVFFVLMIGILAIARFPGLEGDESDKVMTLMLHEIAAKGAFFKLTVSILLLGAMAAIMSTADSVLLSLSSIFVKDFYAKTVRHKTSDENLLRMGKIVSWILTAVVVAVALTSKATLFRLLEIKFEFLMQVAPPFILGFYCRSLGARRAFTGVAVGTTIALIGFFQNTKWWGIHPGVIGCLVNLAICVLPMAWRRQRD